MGRTFPVTLDLIHDYAGWFRQIIRAKDSDRPWVECVPALRSFGPTSFTIEDPSGVSRHGLGHNPEDDYLYDWELVSPVSRSIVSTQRWFDGDRSELVDAEHG